ncbi:hypothetical protein [Maritalea mediterranea]|uniref:Uncharacterized protein n=1 Tax=Maritalea mediterranea TaxID=2909667 RepID=A0ABS9E389_9HYPH|nr:hypothetical protein [Maritalea mediterranea]MCF4097325.1 hypothetical protein [Maritalea mediterranea]
MKNELNIWWTAAGLMSLAVAAIHIFAGTPEIMLPLSKIEMPDVLFAILDVIWNQVSLLLIVVGLALLLAAKRGERARDMVLFINVVYAGIALIFIVAGIYYLQSLRPMPQWVLFIAMAVVAQIGWHKQKGRVH